jgi:hypothetical protein
MTYFNKLDSFDEVAERYAKTAPVLSKNHTLEQDVRPVGKRSRKWERIIKINDNCYALSCGGYADPVFTWGGSSESQKAYPPTAKEIALCSAIVWRRHKDSTETITIRNGAGGWQHNSVYSFICRALPRELWFRQTREGKQFIYNRATGQTLHIPKTRSAPRHLVEHWKGYAKAHTASAWAKKYAKSFQLGDDGLSVTFRREPTGSFTLVGKPHKVMVDRLRVDKGQKREFKQHIDALYAWATTMYPLLRGQMSYDFIYAKARELEEIAKAHNIKGFRIGYKTLFENAEASLVRAVLKNPEHPLRYGLGVNAIWCMARAADYGSHDDDEQARIRYMRSKFTRWINKAAGFETTVKVEK